MNEKASPHPQSRLRRLVAAAVVAAAVVTGSVVAAAPANASQYGSGYGQPGAVHTGVSAVNGTEKPWTIYGSTYGAAFRMPPLTIYRSPATTGAQTVGIVYVLKYYNGQTWVAVNTTAQYTATIPAGQAAVNINQGIGLTANYAGFHYMEVNVVWVAPGRTLGIQNVSLNQARDYRCVGVSSGQKTGSCIVQAGGSVYVT